MRLGVPGLRCGRGTSLASHIWVTDSNWVTELSVSEGIWIRTLKDGTHQFNSPDGIAADGAHIWVNNSDGDSVTDLTAELPAGS